MLYEISNKKPNVKFSEKEDSIIYDILDNYGKMSRAEIAEKMLEYSVKELEDLKFDIDDNLDRMVQKGWIKQCI